MNERSRSPSRQKRLAWSKVLFARESPQEWHKCHPREHRQIEFRKGEDVEGGGEK